MNLGGRKVLFAGLDMLYHRLWSTPKKRAVSKADDAKERQMYADRYASSKRFSSGSMGLAVAINGAVVGALIFSAPVMKRLKPPATIDIFPVPEPAPPEPLPTPQPQPRTDPAPEHIDVVKTPVVDVTRPTDHTVVIDLDPATGTIDGTGTEPVKVDPLPPPLPLIGAEVDPRYADALQPAYPAAERRAGNEGRVVVRVRIGIDGRVKEVQRISAASDAFFEATRRQALARWRFTPAARGGIPQESWKTMSIRFVLRD
jgi:protein TonB